ncbi:hypothetical protein SDC9_189691 [bioreactor metagenome]|uniref:Uncharacterized protein n=1 Tax=bioreactor metagenome TaxID=1076179 RepID=A0A645HSV5_9ZZZZ
MDFRKEADYEKDNEQKNCNQIGNNSACGDDVVAVCILTIALL